MEYRKDNNGWHTLLDQFFYPVLPLTFLVGWAVLIFFQNLNGMPWIHFFVADAILLFSGAGLILYAKFPLYRSGRFFTFGIGSIPQGLKGFYRWGWRIFLIGVALSLCLLLSKQ
jgi:hypothetical protein